MKCFGRGLVTALHEPQFSFRQYLQIPFPLIADRVRNEKEILVILRIAAESARLDAVCKTIRSVAMQNHVLHSAFSNAYVHVDSSNGLKRLFCVDLTCQMMAGVQHRTECILSEVLSNLRNFAKTLLMFRDMNKTMGVEFLRSKLDQQACQKSLVFHLEHELLCRIHAMLYSSDLPASAPSWEHVMEDCERRLQEAIKLPPVVPGLDETNTTNTIVRDSPCEPNRKTVVPKPHDSDSSEGRVIHATPSSAERPEDASAVASLESSQFAVRKRPLEVCNSQSSEDLPASKRPRSRPKTAANRI
eukprot:ANDGO_02775.mRNA.1 hypothetical protein